MGMYKYLREIYKQPKANLDELWKTRLVEWRKEPVTMRIEKPTRLDRARSLGYKAKQGVIVVRQRVGKGKRQRPRSDIGGRRPKTFTQHKIVKTSYQAIAEQRASSRYVNCEVLNSYWVAEDGKHKWYEIILVDRSAPGIQNDKQLGFIADAKGRANRGLTSAGKKVRGLRTKGKGAEKVRPSLRAHGRRAK